MAKAGPEVGAETPSACLDDRHRLGGGELAADAAGAAAATAAGWAGWSRGPDRCRRRPRAGGADGAHGGLLELAPRRRCARSRSVTSLAPTMMSTTSGCSASALVDLRLELRGTRLRRRPARTSRTGRSASSVSAAAMRTPGVSVARCTPRPTALESPRTAKTSGLPRLPRATAVDAVAATAGRCLTVPGLDLAAGGRASSRSSATSAARPRPTAAGAVRRASGRQLVVPCAAPRHGCLLVRCSSSTLSIIALILDEVIGPLRCYLWPISPAGVTQSTELDERAQLIVEVLVDAFSELHGGRRGRVPHQVPQDGSRSFRLLPRQCMPFLCGHGDHGRPVV